MATTTIWHNPRCSKSRQTLALLEDHGVEPTVRRYLDDPPSRDEIAAVVRLLGLDSARGLMRTQEDVYRELGLDEADEAALLDAMASHPRLIERPVVLRGGRAALGRPPEAVLAIL